MTHKNLFFLLSATLAYSCIGPMAKMIPLDAGALSFGRALFAAAALAVILVIKKRPHVPNIGFKGLGTCFLLGCLLAGNWFLFFYAIKISTVAVAVLSLFTYPLMIALLEPLFFRQSITRRDIIAACIILAGIALIVGKFEVQNGTAAGAFSGMLSGLCFSFYTIINRRAVRYYPIPVMLLYQFLTVAVLFSGAAFQSRGQWNLPVILSLVLFGSLFSASAQLFFISALKSVSASVAALFNSLQPFFTVILAAVLISEVPSLRTIVGGGIICGTVITISIMQLRRPLPH